MQLSGQYFGSVNDSFLYTYAGFLVPVAEQSFGYTYLPL
jgi:hypothetical protein